MKGGACWTCGKTGHQSRDCWHNPKGGKGFEKGKGKDDGKGGKALSQGYGKEAGPKGAGKSGGKKGWSPNGFSGQCYNCLEFGHSAKWCPKGKGGGSGCNATKKIP